MRPVNDTTPHEVANNSMATAAETIPNDFFMVKRNFHKVKKILRYINEKSTEFLQCFLCSPKYRNVEPLE